MIKTLLVPLVGFGMVVAVMLSIQVSPAGLGGAAGPAFAITGHEADLVASITDSPSTVTVGGEFTYIVGDQNKGPADATGVILTSPPPRV